jgi:2-methylfumaryl-CoA hydratase
MVLMNLALSFSVHDVSEQTIAHLAYIDLRFPNAAYAGDTISVASEVISTRLSKSQPDRGIVHVKIIGVNQDDVAVVQFERKALMPAGRLEGRAHPPARESGSIHSTVAGAQSHDELYGFLPSELMSKIRLPKWKGRPRGLFDDFEAGDVILHSTGRTVGESEHMQLTVLSRNSHPLHFDELYAREHGFAGTRVVCGGPVFAWVASLASRDTTANALWEINYDKGAHPNPVVGGDTLYAASRVIEKRDYNEQAGIVRFKLVGVKNIRPSALINEGIDLFEDKFKQKVFEIERAVLLPRRGTDSL